MACQELLRESIRTAVITNDQGMKLVDSAFFRKFHIPVRQVVSGCFCCNYSQLQGSIESLVKIEKAQEIFAETVGSCADLVATVVRPLRAAFQDLELSFSVFADASMLYLVLKGHSGLFDEKVMYVYRKQLEEATLLIVNKVDLVSDGLLQELEQLLDQEYSGKKILFQNSLSAESVSKWIQTLREYKCGKLDVNLFLDYARYAAGEANLAWLDQEIEIQSKDGSAPQQAIAIVNAIYTALCESRHPIGHLKFMLDNQRKISFTGPGMRHADPVDYQALTCRLLINARVQTEPGNLGLLVEEQIRIAAGKKEYEIISRSLSVFQPGYPRPEKRLLA
jgi:Ni2+-binding GTPase involved in maturation of urease and hydrogenase